MYKTVIGLEIHAELKTKTKAFCSCSAQFGAQPNTLCCPVCLGLPGAIPVMNSMAVELAIKAGFALGCKINSFSVMDRKNYFYPDLPKAYQISQLYHPIAENGVVEYECDGEICSVRINNIHIEEDAGKLIHSDDGKTLVDYNRCGIPLIEIVTEPDINTSAQAKAFIEEIARRLRYADVCDCRMEQGSLRCDVNISLMKKEDTRLGQRAEIKNLNSIKSIGRAIEYEQQRQQSLLQNGQHVLPQTRRFDEQSGKTILMREKENADDYRYFPEPDIININVSEEKIDKIKKSLPKMPFERYKEYTDILCLSKKDAAKLVSHKELSDYFENTVAQYNSPKSISDFILTEVLKHINAGEFGVESIPVSPKRLADIIKLFDEEKITNACAKELFSIMISSEKSAYELAQENGFIIEIDTQLVNEVVCCVIEQNSEVVAQYKSGQTKVLGFLIGKCNSQLKGKATPKLVKDVLEEMLKI